VVLLYKEISSSIFRCTFNKVKDNKAEEAIKQDPIMYTHFIPKKSAIKPKSAIEILVIVERIILLEAYTFGKISELTFV
jgi:hypothetical protein